MKKQRRLWILALLALAPPALAERPPIVFTHHQVNLESGSHSNNTATETTPYINAVVVPNAVWMRVGIGDYNLGQRSFVVLRSLGDMDEQRFDARSLPVWKNRSALFKGDGVIVELHVAPGEQGIFVNVNQAISGEWQPADLPSPHSQCGGTDDRVAFLDNRVGRMYFGGCTAWRITVGPRGGSADEETFLSAGHCADFDPDQGGPGLPDGNLDLSGVIEFNVPLSTAGGFTNPAPVADQFPVVTTGTRWHFEGEGMGLGKDYSIFGVGRNSNNNLLPHEKYAQLPFRITRESPAAGATIRVTGYGSDTGTANFTSQSHTGPYVGESSSGANFWHEYQVDTEGGNSGSPIIWTANGLAIGIHTNAGCDNPLTADGNTGTSFEHTPLETDLRNYVSTLAKFVDAGHPLRVAEEGTVYRPYSTVSLGVAGVSSNGILSIVPGSYNTAADRALLAGTGPKAMTMVAPVGTVVIGAP